MGTTLAPYQALDSAAFANAQAAVAASGTAQTIPDPTTGVLNVITLTGNCTFTFPTAVQGNKIVLKLIQDGTGSRLATWPAAVKWAGATAPTLSTGAGKGDDFSFDCIDGTTWVGRTIGLDVR
jgi:hypothetical protein